MPNPFPKRLTHEEKDLLIQRLNAQEDADGTQAVLDQIHKFMKK